ncbi:MAG: ATP-binding protein [Nitriliruptorales bacterium]|nr:ATP-binding protein [Nitriliruptorales bacterium]
MADDMEGDQDLLLPYMLRTVRVGVIASVAAITLLAFYPLVASEGSLTSVGGYYALLAVAAAAVGVVAALPWRRLFRSGWGMRLMYVWSVGDILIISGELTLTGGSSSELWVIYILTTIFFAASYPPAGQVVLLALTGLAYTGASLLAGDAEAVPLAVRIASLALLTYMGSYLSRQLMAQMSEHLRHRRDAERHAEVIDRVAGATRRLQSLDPEEVLDAVVETVASLGLPWAGIAELDREEGTFVVSHGRGLPDHLNSRRHDIEGALVEAVEHGRTVTAGQDRDDVGPAWDAVQGFVVAPIHVRGEVVAVLGGARLDDRPVAATVTEAVELLASLAGRAIELATTYVKERETVARLERLDALKRDFVSNVSHELRTPLTVMMGVGELLRGRWEALDDRTRQDLIDRQMAHIGVLNRTIETLLDFSRLEAGKLEPNTEPVDLAEMVRDACRRLDRVLHKHPLDLEVPHRALADVDPDLLQRVVDNLLVNAVTHTPPGTAIHVSVVEAGEWVEVEVADDGPGIPADELRHLTDRFYRGGDPDTRSTRGLGLGLTLVQEILNQHGATLEIESPPGRGASFRFAVRAARRATQLGAAAG